MTPIVDGVRRKYRGEIRVIYVSLDQREGKALAKEHGVVGTPTLLFLDSEGDQVNVLRGSFPSAVLEQAVEDLLAREDASQRRIWQSAASNNLPIHTRGQPQVGQPQGLPLHLVFS
jgi:thioredoxin-like negative regulator of GroEL